MGTGASRNAEGLCFETAVASLLRLRSSELNPKLLHVVHGLPVGTGGEVEGKRYWHAWVELQIDPRSHYWFVYDSTIGPGENNLFSRGGYYDVAQLTEQHVWRFSYDHVIDELQARQHWGPWVDGWEDLEEV